MVRPPRALRAIAKPLPFSDKEGGRRPCDRRRRSGRMFRVSGL